MPIYRQNTNLPNNWAKTIVIKVLRRFEHTTKKASHDTARSHGNLIQTKASHHFQTKHSRIYISSTGYFSIYSQKPTNMNEENQLIDVTWKLFIQTSNSWMCCSTKLFLWYTTTGLPNVSRYVKCRPLSPRIASKGSCMSKSLEFIKRNI